jgi:hypothetical protein
VPGFDNRDRRGRERQRHERDRPAGKENPAGRLRHDRNQIGTREERRQHSVVRHVQRDSALGELFCDARFARARAIETGRDDDVLRTMKCAERERRRQRRVPFPQRAHVPVAKNDARANIGRNVAHDSEREIRFGGRESFEHFAIHR